jgi:3-hydroxybutyryl-CoA dehydrogenase
LKIKNVLIVGTGTLGSQIGFQCARHGFKTTMYDLTDEGLEFCKQNQLEIAEATKADLGLDDSAIAAAHANLSYTTDLAMAGKDADLVSESVPDTPDLKRQVFSELNTVCPDHTIFTTNTSNLLPSEIAAATGRPKQFLALHFANRIWVANVGEVMKHPGTDDGVFERVIKFAEEIGMVPIRIEKENNGYVLNALLIPLLSAAQSLLVRGIASPEDVDRTWMISTQAPLGPFATMDVVGLETAHTIADHLARVTGDEQQRTNADWLKENFLDKGKLGVKSGEGFYKYPDPEYARRGFLT